jgi:hypothetical protein
MVCDLRARSTVTILKLFHEVLFRLLMCWIPQYVTVVQVALAGLDNVDLRCTISVVNTFSRSATRSSK